MKTTSKEIIFARHLNQAVLFDNRINGVLAGINTSNLFGLRVIEDMDNNTPIYKDWNLLDTKLLLSDISNITDEHAILCNYKDASDLHDNIEFPSDDSYLPNDDILRQLGYATEQTVIEDGKPVTYSVEQLVELNVFKLKD